MRIKLADIEANARHNFVLKIDVVSCLEVPPNDSEYE
jgi:hypothetical protein